MKTRNHGKYAKMNMKDPRGIATCDYSGFMTRHSDLKKQMAYRGRGLIWTGFLVNPNFYDTPNAQDLIPLIYVDPRPLINPRPDVEIDNQYATPTLSLDISGNSNVTLSLAQYVNTTQVYYGALTGDVTIFIPGSFNEFAVTNNTTGAFSLLMVIQNDPSAFVLLPQGETSQVWVNDYPSQIKILNPVQN